jgi:hypothetical protein
MMALQSEPIWSSLACGKNYCLNSHTDDDFFYSLTTIVLQHGLQPGRFVKYRLDAEVRNYFAFAEQGIAVALRTGEMLLFNALIRHCLTSCTMHCQEKDVFCVSLYLKTAVVGGNNNNVLYTQIHQVWKSSLYSNTSTCCTPNSPMLTVIMLLALGSLFEGQNLYTK